MSSYTSIYLTNTETGNHHCHLFKRDPQRPQHPHVLSKHSQLHGGAVTPLQRQEEPAAKQPVSERHGFVLGQESQVQVLKRGQAWRRNIEVQRVQPGLPGKGI